MKSTYSDLGYGDFGEWVLGHRGGINMTYYSKPEKERIELFKKLQHYLTFLDARQLDASTADVKAENEALKTTLLKVREEVSELQGYKDNFEKVVTFMKQVFPENAQAIEQQLTKG